MGPMGHYVLAVHIGAGYHGDRKRREYTKLISDVLSTTIERVAYDAQASDVVTTAVSVMENIPRTNAGVGSSLTIDGNVECDAMVCTADSVGSVGAIRDVRNPCIVADALRKTSRRRGALGLVPPCFLTGRGAQQFAVSECGMPVEPGCHLTNESVALWHGYRARVDEATAVVVRAWSEPVADTVGAVCLDVHGNLASAASSGGHWLKHNGRIGAAAVPNAGACVRETVAVAASGNGERLMQQAFSLQCATALVCTAEDRQAISILARQCEAGFIALQKLESSQRVEVIAAHATPSMAFGYYCPSSMSGPFASVSVSHSTDSVVFNGYVVSMSSLREC